MDTRLKDSHVGFMWNPYVESVRQLLCIIYYLDCIAVSDCFAIVAKTFITLCRCPIIDNVSKNSCKNFPIHNRTLMLLLPILREQ